MKLYGQYVAVVSGNPTVVLIDRESIRGGWEATNVRTNHPVRIRTAARLLRPATPSEYDLARERRPIRRAV